MKYFKKGLSDFCGGFDRIDDGKLGIPEDQLELGRCIGSTSGPRFVKKRQKRALSATVVKRQNSLESQK